MELTRLAESALTQDSERRITSINWKRLEELKQANPVYYQIFKDTLIDDLVAQESLKLKPSAHITSPAYLTDSLGNFYNFIDIDLREELNSYLESKDKVNI